MKDIDVQFENIVYLNFGAEDDTAADNAPEEDSHDWVGFSEQWLAAYRLPEEDSTGDPRQESINAHVRKFLPALVNWLIADGVADQMEEYADFDDWVPGLAEILMVAAYGSHWDGSYCGGTVGQQSIAVMDWGRLAAAFMEVYDEWLC